MGSNKISAAEKIILAYPHSYCTPPEGNYRVLDMEPFEEAWKDKNPIATPSYDEIRDLEKFLKKNVEPGIMVPLCEEAVLISGMMNSYWGLGGISLNTAILCTSRFYQRKKLGKLNGLNWIPLRSYDENKHCIFSCSVSRRAVLKAPASTLSKGVTICSSIGEAKEKIAALMFKAGMEVARLIESGIEPVPILEELIEHSIQYEINGVAFNGEVDKFFDPIISHWTSDLRVEEYKKADFEINDNLNTALKSLASTIVREFDMDCCGFCMEFRPHSLYESGHGVAIIDVHCRLGEDDKSHEILISPFQNSIQGLYSSIRHNLIKSGR